MVALLEGANRLLKPLLCVIASKLFKTNRIFGLCDYRNQPRFSVGLSHVLTGPFFLCPAKLAFV